MTVANDQHRQLTLDIPSALWLTSNQRLHWAAKAKRTRAIRHLAAVRARNERIRRFTVVHVTAYIGYPTNAKADPANAYPSVKAAIDGLVDAGVLAEDDDKHVLGPDMRRDTKAGRLGMHRIRLVLTDQEVPF